MNERLKGLEPLWGGVRHENRREPAYPPVGHLLPSFLGINALSSLRGIQMVAMTVALVWQESMGRGLVLAPVLITHEVFWQVFYLLGPWSLYM